MRFLIVLLVIGVVVIATIEFGVWMMKGMLGGDVEHHASRASFARIVGYIIGAIALVAFLSLSTGVSAWVVPGLLVAIPIAIVLAYRRPSVTGE